MSPSPVSSTPILRTALTWSAVVTLALAAVGAAVGLAVGGSDGLWSALAGVVIAAVFCSITALSILIANRWYGQDLYVPLFFGIVMGGWILKLVVFVIVLIVLRGQPWIDGPVFFVALVVSVIAALAIDVIVLMRMRIPHVSDVSLPTTDPDEDSGTLKV